MNVSGVTAAIPNPIPHSQIIKDASKKVLTLF